MSEVNSPSSYSNEIDLAEAQLQQELRSMFDVDAQTYLQSYMDIVEKLEGKSWTTDIQEMYRCIHTIKGGAVTVGADAILHVSTALEEILSDLRYLQTAPELTDARLTQMLSEAGELLTASLQVEEVGDRAYRAVQLSLDRLTDLRQEIQKSYLAEFDERTQLFHEFADRGFDLVVLDLEMAIEDLEGGTPVPAKAVNTTKDTLRQLIQIGKDLEFDRGWKELLNQSKQFLTRLESDFWREKWSDYLKQLKDCARKGGAVPKAQPQASKEPIIAPSSEDNQTSKNISPTSVESEVELLWGEEEVIQKPTSEQTAPTPSVSQTAKTPDANANVQIPVPLERLNRSAKNLVETLLSARASRGYHQTLESQLVQLSSLAQETVGYITELRQVQNDYALLESLQEDRNKASEGPTLESYRRGYTIINRLLESSLRISELGAEASSTSRKTSESFTSLDRSILNLQQTVEDSRLVPFSNLAFRAKAILRDLSVRYKKPVQLTIQGEKLQLDVATFQNLEPMLLHLIRNAFDHGLELPEERVAKGKPAQGNVLLSLQRQGNSYLFYLKDDGRGIDPKTIANLAQTRGMPLTNTDTPAQLLAVLSQPGFSSQSQVSEISGRGVGMDVVAAQVASLKGQISLETTKGSGTTFYVKLPVPHLLVRCILITANDRTFAIPVEEIITTKLWGDVKKTQPVEENLPYSYLIEENENLSLPALNLSEYWQKNVKHSLTDTAICLRVRSSSLGSQTQEAWLLADDLLEQIDLLINPIPNPLVTPIGLMGVSLQNDGKLIPVIEPTTIVQRLWLASGDYSFNQNDDSGSVDSVPDTMTFVTTILVVDDAALIRRRIEVSLTNYGYAVQTCRDGLEAWKWLSSNPAPAMMITDIEMPGMDGFTLIDRCRQNGIDIPIVVVSSRLSEEWGKEARRVGATDYLTKGFTTPELIAKVQSLVG